MCIWPRTTSRMRERSSSHRSTDRLTRPTTRVSASVLDKTRARSQHFCKRLRVTKSGAARHKLLGVVSGAKSRRIGLSDCCQRGRIRDTGWGRLLP
jgi:hypothetical protein